MNLNNDDTIFARWLNGNITPEEKKLLEESGDLVLLEKIAKTTEEWSLPPLKKEFYDDLKLKIESKNKAVLIPLYRRRSFLAIAATFLLLVGAFGIYRYFFSEKIITLTCSAGQQQNYTLPDGTAVSLNGKSEITYDENSFTRRRDISLSGQAFFHVKEKGPFTVKFSQGNVRVLGTQFDILTSSEKAFVKCYEGKVQVENKAGHSEILTLKQEVIFSGSGIFSPEEMQEELPAWINKTVNLSDKTLFEITALLSVHYDIEFENKSVDLNRKYSGELITYNLDLALKTIFEPMGIRYSRKGNLVIIEQ